MLLHRQSVALELSYVIEISVTEQSGTTCNHGPEAFPSSFLDVSNASMSFGVFIARVPKFGGCFFSGSHHAEE